MKINTDMLNNTVSAKNQTTEKFKLHDDVKNGFRVLFLGNSITIHEKAPQIGWFNNWGMAASREENDYVHLVVKEIEKVKGKINYCVCNVGAWEQNFTSDAVLKSFFGAKDFGADLVIIRLGENVKPDMAEQNDFQKYFLNFVNYFKAKETQVVITDLFWECETFDAIIKKVCEDVGASFVHISDLGYDEKNKAIGQFEHKGVALHPNDTGMKLIAERIMRALNL